MHAQALTNVHRNGPGLQCNKGHIVKGSEG